MQAAIAAGARRVAIVASRRSGKSFLSNALLAIRCATTPNARCVYIALTHASVKLIAWDIIHKLDREFGLSLKYDQRDLKATFPNGSTITYRGVGGISNREIQDRFRGAQFDACVIDEASAFEPAALEHLVQTIIEPTLLDRDGVLLLTGTPSPNCRGIYHEATTTGRPRWLSCRWLTSDNPHMAAQYAAELDKNRRENPAIESAAWYRREYFGEWVADTNDLVYQVAPENIVDAVDTAGMSFVLAVDLGYTDDTSFLLVGWGPYGKTLSVLESTKRKRMLPDEIAHAIHDIRQRYPGVSIVVDSGSGGAKTLVEELAVRYGIPSNPAQKTEKANWIRLLNSDLSMRRVHIVRAANRDLLSEIGKLPWRERNGRREEDPSFDNHLCDAMLYAYRQARHHLTMDAPFAPQSAEQRMMEHAFAKNRQHRQSSGWRH